MDLQNIQIGIIGLGYIGLPLAVEFGKVIPTIGFDIDINRLEELKQGIDRTLEVTNKELAKSSKLILSSNPDHLKECTVYIVTVPTPINEHKAPDLSLIKRASKIIGGKLDVNDIVLYESTVYPGVTEENLCSNIGIRI